MCMLCLKHCIAADPFLNDQNFILSVLSLEELGATGNKVTSSRIAFAVLFFIIESQVTSIPAANITFAVYNLLAVML